MLDPGSEDPGSHDHVRVALQSQSQLVLGESFNRGWRATCDGHSLGAPVVVDGYANGWTAPAGCRNVSFSFTPNRLLDVGYVISALAALAMLVFLVVRRRRPEPPLEAGELRTDDGLPGLPLRHALVAGVLAALVFGFAFALRLGVIAGPAVALILWRGVGSRRLTLAAGGLLAIVVPIVYLIWPGTDRGGWDSRFAQAHTGAHWVAVAAFILLTLALARTLSTASGRTRAPAPAGEDAPRAGP